MCLILQSVPTSFGDSFPGWNDNYSASAHTSSPCVKWDDIPALDGMQVEDEDTEGEEDDLQDAASHIPLDGAAHEVLGDGQPPQMVHV